MYIPKIPYPRRLFTVTVLPLIEKIYGIALENPEATAEESLKEMTLPYPDQTDKTAEDT